MRKETKRYLCTHREILRGVISNLSKMGKFNLFVRNIFGNIIAQYLYMLLCLLFYGTMQVYIQDCLTTPNHSHRIFFYFPLKKRIEQHLERLYDCVIHHVNMYIWCQNYVLYCRQIKAHNGFENLKLILICFSSQLNITNFNCIFGKNL